MSVYIDINCDMGESYGRWTLGNDEEVMPHITSANIACGFHGGDPHVMRRTVELALQYGVAIGSHPGLPDLMGFGRRRMEVTPAELKDYHRYQTGALGAFVKAAGARLQHIKPHGIQYHMFEENLPLARATAEQVVELDPELILMTMAMTKYDAEARKVPGVRIAAEGFADRVYADDAQLVSRKLGKDALITDPYDPSTPQTLALRGSDNQRLHLLTTLGRERLSGYARPLQPTDRALDVHVTEDGEVWLAGIPRRGDLDRLTTMLVRVGYQVHTSEGRQRE